MSDLILLQIMLPLILILDIQTTMQHALTVCQQSLTYLDAYVEILHTLVNAYHS